MSTYFADIRRVLERTLKAMRIETAWENVSYEPTQGKEFVRCTLMPGEVTQVTLGSDGKDYQRGILQLDYFMETGTGPVSSMPDSIADSFKRGSIHKFNGVRVVVRSVSVDAGRREDAWFIVPIIVNYFAYTGARSLEDVDS